MWQHALNGDDMLWIFLLLVLMGGVAFWRYASLRIFQGVPEGDYTVIERHDRYELRDYEPFIAAETDVRGDIGDASDEGFAILSRHVLASGLDADSVVLRDGRRMPAEAPTHTVSVAIPEHGGVAAAKPDDPRISTKLYPGRVVAAMRFGWYPTLDRIMRKASDLESLLLRDGFTAIGEPELVLSDAPFSPPFFMKSEILMEVEG